MEGRKAGRQEGRTDVFTKHRGQMKEGGAEYRAPTHCPAWLCHLPTAHGSHVAEQSAPGFGPTAQHGSDPAGLLSRDAAQDSLQCPLVACPGHCTRRVKGEHRVWAIFHFVR